MSFPSPGALDRLLAHQNAMTEIMHDAETMLTDSRRRDVAGLARARWALMRALTAYQLFKQREVFDPLLARAAPGDANRLLRMKRASAELCDAFRGNVQRWSAVDVDAMWATYQPSALAMIARIREHLAGEREAVRGLLSG